MASIDDLNSKYGGSAPVSGTSTAPSNLPAFNIEDSLANVPILWDRAMLDPSRTSTTFSDRTSRATTTYGTVPVSRSFAEGLGGFYQYGPQQLTLIQAQLINSGFLSDKKWTSFGVPEEKSYEAWKDALTRAARSGQTIWEVLGVKDEKTLGDNAQAYFDKALATVSSRIRSSSGGGGGAGRAPLQVRYTNPEDLRVIATQAATSVLGSVPDGTFVDSFVKTYQEIEGTAQKAAYGSGNYTAPADPSVIAAKQARTKYATQATGQSVAKVFDSFLNIVSGSPNG